jgi:hypothetical protein
MLGMALPTDPIFSSSMSGGRYEMRVHSVWPYMHTMSTFGSSSRSRWMWAGGRAAAALVT